MATLLKGSPLIRQLFLKATLSKSDPLGRQLSVVSEEPPDTCTTSDAIKAVCSVRAKIQANYNFAIPFVDWSVYVRFNFKRPGVRLFRVLGEFPSSLPLSSSQTDREERVLLFTFFVFLKCSGLSSRKITRRFKFKTFFVKNIAIEVFL